MASSHKNLSGSRFGRLLVLDEQSTRAKDNSDWVWSCVCNCGGNVRVRAKSLKKGTTRSCGCFQRESASKVNTTHGLSKSKEFMSWAAMHTRCTNPNQESFANYGARGISVCERWNSFENFLADMGPKPSPRHTIERMDNERGYNPTNCRWATRAEQNTNTRQNRYLTFKGKTMALSQWAREVGLTGSALTARLNRGWSIDDALTTPPITRTKNELIYTHGGFGE